MQTVPNLTRRQVAEQIAADLFENGLGERAQRLVMIVDTPARFNLGGWTEEAVTCRIKQWLDLALDERGLA